MLQTLNPYTSTAKTAQIMARYRPIAPRPNGGGAGGGSGGGGDTEGSGSGSGSVSGSGSSSSPTAMSPTIRQSPYLRNVWPHLQSRPTRTRKRGRTSLGPPPPPAFKRPRSLLQGLAPSPSSSPSPTSNLSIQGFAQIPNFHTTLVTLPLLPCSSPHHHHMQQPNVIDLNTAVEIPEEKDLLAQLQKPATNLISPTPLRLIPSTVTIKTIIKDNNNNDNDTVSSSLTLLKKQEEVEKELESEVLPAFVSDSNYKVRLVNSAYKQMVGQPECTWLESIMTGGDTCNTICGQVVLNFVDSDDWSRKSTGGFSCKAKIEWGENGKKGLVNAFGEAMRLACESKDYTFAWRFRASEAASNV